MEFDSYSITGKEATEMRSSNRGSFRDQVSFLSRQFLQDGDLPFTKELFGQAFPGMAVGPGLGRAGRLALRQPVSDQAGDRGPARFSALGRGHQIEDAARSVVFR
jgi:hypothetical protein